MHHSFDPAAVGAVEVDNAAVHRAIARLTSSRAGNTIAAHTLRRAIAHLDLTSLRGDETPEEVRALCHRAVEPIATPPDGDRPHTAAVCVFPEQVETARRALEGTPVRVAAACFGPTPGSGAPEHRVEEIARAVALGAHEIDVVITVSLAAAEAWEALYEEVARFREAAGAVTTKVILASGALPTPTAVARATSTAILAGAGFVKTSTGRERVNATLPAGFVMARVIRDHHARTGEAVGLKPAGGIRTAEAARDWLQLVDAELGPAWGTPARFRIGASGLLEDLAGRLHAETLHREDDP